MTAKMNRPLTTSDVEETKNMSTTMAAGHARARDVASRAAGRYSRYAEMFSRVYHETGSLEIALEVHDTLRAREGLAHAARPDLPERILEVVASLFGVSKRRLHERSRHRDVTSARYVAAWVLFRRHWTKAKIGVFFDLDHSTVIHGLRRVAGNTELLVAAHRAAQLLEDAERTT
jgi:chromosomal replication initiation ATPase DnaA